VGVRGRQDLDVGDAEPECFDVRANLRDRIGQAGVDDDVTLGRGDQVAGQIVRAYPADVADDAEGLGGT
jgi:hypothetical protein